MENSEDRKAQERLASYISDIGDLLGNEARRAAFAMYAYGLFGPAERKTMEAIAAQACPDEARAGAAHQRLQHFVSNSEWSDSKLRLAASQYAVAEMTRHSDIETWIVDDTGFLKQGKHSVGVQRQYTGSAGKITNCQIGTSLTLATSHAHVPVDFELYIPEKCPPAAFDATVQKVPVQPRVASNGDLPDSAQAPVRARAGRTADSAVVSAGQPESANTAPTAPHAATGAPYPTIGELAEEQS